MDNVQYINQSYPDGCQDLLNNDFGRLKGELQLILQNEERTPCIPFSWAKIVSNE